MKYLQLIVFSLIFVFSSLGEAASALFSEGPAPKQSYQSAAIQRKHALQVVKASRIAEKTAKMSSQPSEVAHSLPVKQHEPSAASVSLLQSQINQLNQATLRFEQMANSHMARLRRSNAVLKTQLQHMTQAMLLMNAQLAAMKARLSHQQAKPEHDHWSYLLPYLSFAMVAFLALVLGYSILRRGN